MATSAQLNIEVKSTGVTRAERDLKKITSTGKKTEAQVVKLQNGFKGFGRNASAAIATIDGPLGGISSRVSALTALATTGGIAITGFAVAVTGLTAVIASGVSTLDEYNVGLAKTEALLEATGFAAGVTAQQLQDEAQAIAFNTLASVQGIQRAQSVLLTFNNIQGDVRRQAVGLTQDLATVFGGTAASQATQLGKALQDPIKGITALNRVGVSFNETQKQQIKLFQESGEPAKAQGVILQALTEQVGGAGQAVNTGLVGATDALGQSWDNFTSTLAGSTGAYDTTVSFFEKLERGIRNTTKLLQGDLTGQTTLIGLERQIELQFDILELEQQKETQTGRTAQATQLRIDALREELGLAKEQTKELKTQSDATLRAEEARRARRQEIKEESLASIRDQVQQENAIWSTEYTGPGSQAWIDARREQSFELYNLQIDAAKEAAAKANEIALEFRESQAELAGGLSDTFGGLAEAVKGFGGETSAAYKAAFALSQGFAVAQASLNFGLALSQALALPADVSLAAKFASYAAVASAGGAVLSSISGVSYSGRQQGGDVTGPVMVGERGPELFVPNGNGKIVNNNKLNNSTESQEVNLTIINQTTGRIDQAQTTVFNNDQRLQITAIIKEVVPQELADSNSRTSKTLNSQTSANRRLT